MQFYNLDAIISVGYRVKSKTATHFRQWATKILRNYMIEGYAINEKRLREQEKKLELLKSTLSLIERGIDNKLEVQHLKNFLKDFSAGFNMLDAYDHEKLDTKGRSKSETAVIEPEEFWEMIQSMRTAFDSDVFGRPKDESFESSVRQIYQSFGGVDCYETLEEKAAMLLYLIVKNHSFVDGNKRIAAASFLYFLNKNNLLYKSDGKPVIDDNTLFALTILVAESDKSEMETTKNMIITILNARN
jgi:death-on-curing family protein